jgi:hypothetical protein
MARHKGTSDAENFDEYEDESDVFLRRREWFGQMLGERDGTLSPAARLLARDQTARLRPPALEELDPGGDPPKRGHHLATPKGIKARTRRKEPTPRVEFRVRRADRRRHRRRRPTGQCPQDRP